MSKLFKLFVQVSMLHLKVAKLNETYKYVGLPSPKTG